MKELAKTVHDLIERKQYQEQVIFDSNVIDAMRLADLFESVKPQEYILPLNEMIGLPLSIKKEL